jgi:hypothetical protein
MEFNLLYLGVVVFSLLLAGVAFTVSEFRITVNPPKS